MILNLAVNARDAMPRGGVITIETGAAVISGGHPVLAPGDYVVLAIRDTGTGMSAEVQRHLAPHRQRLSLDPPLPERATVGGVVAANAFGPRRTRYGPVRDLVIGVQGALSVIVDDIEDGSTYRRGEPALYCTWEDIPQQGLMETKDALSGAVQYVYSNAAYRFSLRIPPGWTLSRCAFPHPNFAFYLVERCEGGVGWGN